MNRQIIKDTMLRPVGWLEDNGTEIKYWGNTKGLIGRYVKSTSIWWYANGTMGPRGDIGYSEVLKAEGTR